MGIRVPAVGPRDAKIALVGEAPATEETRAGEPFVGQAGKQLNSMLTSAGLAREDIYITNLIKEPVPPEDNAKQAYFFRGKAPTHEMMQGILELVTEFSEIRPNVIMPLGNYALWALTQKSGITKWRGSIIESTLITGQKIIPTVHPAYYTHGYYFNLHEEALGIWDFTRAAEESTFPEIRLPTAEFLTNPTSEELDRAVDRLLSAEWIACDTEWYGPEKLAYIGFSDSPDWSICVPYRGMSALRFYRRVLESDVPKVWQNVMFDAVALSRMGINVRNVKHDLMVGWHNCWTDIRKKDLGTISSVLTKWPYYKDGVGFVGRDDDLGQRYCCTDCVATYQSWQRVEQEEFDYTRGRRGYEISMSAMDIFLEASKRGVRGDYEKMLQLKTMYLERASRVEQVLSEMLDFSLNCRSPQQVATVVYDMLGVKRSTRSTKQEILMDIAASSDDEETRALLTSIIRVRQDRNIVSRYVNEKIFDNDGRLRTNWNVAGTRSGRFSSTDPWWNGLAMQTVPEDARVLFIPDDGCVFVGWDYEQAEARVVAIKTHDEELMEDMLAGIDIHLKLAAKLPFGLTYEQLSDLIEKALAAGKSKDTVRPRYLTKKCRHALNYVMGAGTFKMTVNKEWLDTGIGLNDSSAKSLRAAYLDLHPGLQEWWNNVKRLIQKSPRTLTNCLGRTRNFLGLVDNIFTEAVSFEPQSTVADLNTLCIVEADKHLKKIDPTAQCFAHMHDGGFFQVREECASEAAEIIRETMTRELVIDRIPLTIPVEIKLGRNWLEMEKVKNGKTESRGVDSV